MTNDAPSQVPRAATELPLQRHWWVNHRRSDRAEVDGSYLWLPNKTGNGSRTASHQNMTRLGPGDIVFSCTAGAIDAIGVVLERARSAPMVADFEVAGASTPVEDGWLVPVRFVALAEPLRPRDHMAAIKPLLPQRQSPLRVSGEANSRVQLTELATPMAALLRRLLTRQVEDCEERIGIELDGKLAEDAIEEQLWQRPDIAPAERRQLISARVGQGIFRERVEQTETACRVTGILDRRYLRATHIKPWKDADDREKIDGLNGLLLSPHIHHLFERGHISFADEGTLLISRHLNPYVRSAWGLERPVPARAFAPQQRAYLNYHRTRVFEKTGGGRRSVSDAVHEKGAAG